jgi:hypothetical protein
MFSTHPFVTHVHLQYQAAGHSAITFKEGHELGSITMCFVVRKTTSELEHMILTTLYLAGAKNTNKYMLGFQKFARPTIFSTLAAHNAPF